MKKRFTSLGKITAIISVLLLISLAFGSGFIVASFQPNLTRVSDALISLDGTSSQSPGSIPPALEVFHETWDLIEQDFFGTLPTNRERVYGSVRGLLAALEDPYTVFVEPIPRQLEQDALRGAHGGIGVTLNRNADDQVIVSPYRNSPAAQKGILEGDILIAVGDIKITDEMDVYRDIEPHIRGDVGTDVTLTLQRASETLSFTITRQLIEVPSVNWRMLDQAPTLGYIQVTSFTDRTVNELKEGLAELYVNEAQGLILDLRNNGGGLLQPSIDLADQFLADGVVLYEVRRNHDEKTYVTTELGDAQTIPLAVLINGGTASASEIVAGAIQDHKRGPLIGQPTYGKGSVQLIFDLSDGSSVHVTAARWYTPNRHQLDGIGLAPDLEVDDQVDDGVDAQLERGIQYLVQGF